VPLVVKAQACKSWADGPLFDFSLFGFREEDWKKRELEDPTQLPGKKEPAQLSATGCFLLFFYFFTFCTCFSVGKPTTKRKGGRELELELELILSQMAQKPMLRG
jgi:hypothetical protein